MSANAKRCFQRPTLTLFMIAFPSRSLVLNLSGALSFKFIQHYVASVMILLYCWRFSNGSIVARHLLICFFTEFISSRNRFHGFITSQHLKIHRPFSINPLLFFRTFNLCFNYSCGPSIIEILYSHSMITMSYITKEVRRPWI